MLKYQRILYECKFGGVGVLHGDYEQQLLSRNDVRHSLQSKQKKIENEYVLQIVKFDSTHDNHNCDSAEYGMQPNIRNKVIEKNAAYLQNVSSMLFNSDQVRPVMFLILFIFSYFSVFF